MSGIHFLVYLPLIDDFTVCPKIVVLDCIVCLNAVAAVARGFDRFKALEWLSQEGMLERLIDGGASS